MSMYDNMPTNHIPFELIFSAIQWARSTWLLESLFWISIPCPIRLGDSRPSAIHFDREKQLAVSHRSMYLHIYISMAIQLVILIHALDTDDFWFCGQSHSIAQHIFQRGAIWTLWVVRRVIDWIVRASGDHFLYISGLWCDKKSSRSCCHRV